MVKCRNQTVLAAARALLKQRGMPAVYWGEAKLDERSSPGVFISYVEGAKAYRMLDPAT